MICLNSEQQRAVQAPNKPILVLAGAGTGKTRVLIERIIKFINEDKIDHRYILAITFTNKARDEIRSRIANRIGDARIPPSIFTFHAFFHQVLRVHAEKLDQKFRNFKLLDENDQRAIIRRLLKQLPKPIYTENLNLWDARAAEDAIGRVKIMTNDLMNPEPIKRICKMAKVTEKELLSFYKIYQQELRNNILFDYNDLEIYTYRVLDIPEVREYWSSRSKVILIDEFQDTSELQMEIVKKLTNDQSNIFCVGDPDQSIYGFRGAKPRVCSEFLEHFNAECIKLEENYRSTQTILDIANHLILKNHADSKIYKRLRSSLPGKGNKVVCIRFGDEWDEVRFVADEIGRIIKSDPQTSLKDFAILYRNNIFSKLFEIVFKERNIECEVANTVDFFSRMEIKFIVAFLRLLYFHDDVGSGVYIQTITDTLKIGVGEASCHAFFNFLSRQQLNFREGIEKIGECAELKPAAKKGLVKLWGWVAFLLDKREDSFVKITETIAKITGYADQLKEKNEEGRLENIRQFAESLDRNPEGKNNREMVEEISLRAKEIKKTKSDDFLFLSTVHQAKGLEYKYVFVVKMLHDIFPSRRSKTPEEVEEERRLAYVAFTRAKKGLYITCSPSSAGKWGDAKEERPSVFINEIVTLTDKVEFRDQRRNWFVPKKSFTRFY